MITDGIHWLLEEVRVFVSLELGEDQTTSTDLIHAHASSLSFGCLDLSWFLHRFRRLLHLHLGRLQNKLGFRRCGSAFAWRDWRPRGGTRRLKTRNLELRRTNRCRRWTSFLRQRSRQFDGRRGAQRFERYLRGQRRWNGCLLYGSRGRNVNLDRRRMFLHATN